MVFGGYVPNSKKPLIPLNANCTPIVATIRPPNRVKMPIARSDRFANQPAKKMNASVMIRTFTATAMSAIQVASQVDTKDFQQLPPGDGPVSQRVVVVLQDLHAGDRFEQRRLMRQVTAHTEPIKVDHRRLAPMAVGLGIGTAQSQQPSQFNHRLRVRQDRGPACVGKVDAKVTVLQPRAFARGVGGMNLARSAS